jgi:peptide/nickel transport system substrate-binding protein
LKRLLIPLAILLVCAFIITGCGTDSTPTTTKPAATSTAPTSATSVPAATTAATTKPATTAPSASAATTAAATTATTPAASGTPRYGGTFRWIDPTGPATPIGWNPETSGSSVFTMQLSQQFMLKEMQGGKLVPNLAESWDIVSDPKNASITFHLRKGVKFHDGTDCNAKAVAWCFEKTKAGGMTASATNFWKSFDVVDDYTVRVNLSTWANRLSRGFADGVAYVWSPTAYEKNGIDWIRNNMVGTGPFMQKDFKRDVSTTVTKYTNYYEQGKPYLDEVQLLYVTDELTRVALFKSGGAEVLNLSGNPRLASELEAAGFNIITQPGGATVLVPDSLNKDSPWSNIKVRMAADYAIDKESIAKAFGYGYWTAAYQLNSPASMAFDKNIPGRKFDVAKAKQLLTEAGYPTGFKTKIIVQVGSNRDIPVAVQSFLSKAGIQAEIEMMEPAKYTATSTGTWTNALIMNPLIEWANPNTGFNFFWGVPGSWFKSMSKPEGWGDMVTASNSSPAADPVLTQKLESTAYEDAMVIPLYYGISQWATTKNVRDSGIGTRGAGTWFEPQYTWLAK